MAAKVEREFFVMENFKSDWEAGEAAGLFDVDVAKDTEGQTEFDDRPRSAMRDKLLANLQGIAGREASRLCANLGPRLTPEMAMAVFQGLTIQVDALISGSGVVAGPIRGMSQHLQSQNMSGLPVVNISSQALPLETPYSPSTGSGIASVTSSPGASHIPPQGVMGRVPSPGTARVPVAGIASVPAPVQRISNGDGDGGQQARGRNGAVENPAKKARILADA